jgi:hypothetical protein
MIKLAIDLNDVVRDFTHQFANYYKKEKDPTFDVDKLVYSEESIFGAFEFEDIEELNEFMFIDYPQEIFAFSKTVEDNTSPLFNIWLNKLQEYDGEQPKVSFIAPNEHNLAIQCTLYFLSKTGSRVREVIFPTSSKEIWDAYDVVITTNPIILKTKPQDKVVIKINTEYNKSFEADYNYDKLTDFLNDEGTWMDLLKLEE